jgi:hypothetical protein
VAGSRCGGARASGGNIGLWHAGVTVPYRPA